MVTLILTIAAIGFIAWLLVTLIPMPAPYPRIIIGISCLIVLLLVLQAFGLVGPMPRLR